MDGAGIALVLVGAFYAFAGVVSVRAGLTSYFLDQALAGLTLQKTPRAERIKTAWLLSAAAVIYAGGVALMFLARPAVWLFAAAAVAQVLYAGVLAPCVIDRESPPDATGRRQSNNAMVLYLAATAFVIWADATERLLPVSGLSPLALTIAAALILAFAIYVARALVPGLNRVTADSRGSGWPMVAGTGDNDNDAGEFARDWMLVRRVKLMAETHCDPLWALDGDHAPISPFAFGLSDVLARDIDAWADAYTRSYNPEDPANSLWSAQQRDEHDLEGRRLARRIKIERPELQVHVLQDNVGLVEVHADTPEDRRDG